MHSLRIPRRRLGASTLEAIVAFTLLSSVLGVATPLVVRHGRLLQAQQDYRLALDELSSQLDRLTSLPDAELAPAMEKLTPSALAAQELPGVQLRGQVQDGDLGQRVQLRIWWDEPNRQSAPLVLSAWRFSNAMPPASEEP